MPVDKCRIIGTGPAIIVFDDIFKGILAVLLGRAVGGEVFSLWCGVAVIIGHNWPIFLDLGARYCY